MIVALPDLAAMNRLGQVIAAQLRPGDVVALSGALGTGKTTLARAIIAALGYTGEVPSPSFSILEIYSDLMTPVVHADFYRLARPQETDELGLDDYRGDHALIAEWPKRAGGFDSEPGCLSLALEIADYGRKAIVRTGPDWLERSGLLGCGEST